MTWIWRLRAAVLTLLGVLVVHQGRYAFAPPDHAHELSSAHAYLVWLGPLAGILLFLAVVHFAAHVRRLHDAPQLPRGRSLWLAAGATLLTVFTVQESLETLFAHGHLPEISQLLASGGWTAIPFAVAAGAIIALLLRGAATVVRWMLRRARRPRRDAAPAPTARPTPLRAPRASVLARRLAGRAPPLPS